jgi:hypothetical protein
MFRESWPDEIDMRDGRGHGMNARRRRRRRTDERRCRRKKPAVIFMNRPSSARFIDVRHGGACLPFPKNKPCKVLDDEWALFMM